MRQSGCRKAASHRVGTGRQRDPIVPRFRALHARDLGAVPTECERNRSRHLARASLAADRRRRAPQNLSFEATHLLRGRGDREHCTAEHADHDDCENAHTPRVTRAWRCVKVDRAGGAGPVASRSTDSYGFSFERRVDQFMTAVRDPVGCAASAHAPMPAGPKSQTSNVHVWAMYSEAIQTELPSVTAAP